MPFKTTKFVVQSGATATIKSKLSVRLTSGVTVTQGSEFRAIVNTAMNSNMIVKYTYNQLGQLTGIGNSSNNNYFAQYIYNPDGTVSQEKVNNLGSVTNYQFNNPRGFLTSIANNAFTENLSYTNGYGGASYYNGSIASSSFNYGTGGPTSYNYTFQYDQYNRMTNAANSANTSYNYTSIQYDNNGNLSYRLDGTSGVKNFTYHSGTNKLKNLTGFGTAYFYDENGNMATTGGKTFTYDPFTMLTQSITEGGTQVRFQYDGRKERILKTVSQNGNNTSTLYLRGTNEYPLTEKIGSSQNAIDRFYVYGLKGLVAVVDNGATYFVLKDHLGSTRAVLNNNNVAVSWYDYTPYGSVWRTTVSEDVRYRFTGQEYDYETNLFNFRARMYDSELGIFYGVDPAGQGFSPYSYCGGNPTMYIDKDGRFFIIDDFVYGFVRGLVEGKNPWKEGAQSAHNSYEIWSTMFRGNFGQILNKWTWGFPTQLIGITVAHVPNITGDIAHVSHRDGATLVETKAGDSKKGKWGFTIGSVITTSSGVTTEDYLFMHEYGHYVQSQILGPLYMPVIAFPSLASAAFSDERGHHNFYTESWANQLAVNHFGEDYQDYLRRQEKYWNMIYGRSSSAYPQNSNYERFGEMNTMMRYNDNELISPVSPQFPQPIKNYNARYMQDQTSKYFGNYFLFR